MAGCAPEYWFSLVYIVGQCFGLIADALQVLTLLSQLLGFLTPVAIGVMAPLIGPDVINIL